MSLVEDEVVPRFPPEDVLIGENELVRSDADVESVLGVPSSSLLLSVSLVSVVGHDFKTGEELQTRNRKDVKGQFSEREGGGGGSRVEFSRRGTHLLELHLPVEDDRSRNDDEMRSPHSLFAGEVRKKRDRLDRLPVKAKQK